MTTTIKEVYERFHNPPRCGRCGGPTQYEKTKEIGFYPVYNADFFWCIRCQRHTKRQRKFPFA